MIFFTILFLIFNLSLLIVGRPFRQLAIDIGEEEIKKAKLGTDNYKENEDIVAKIMVMFLYVFVVTISYLIYFSFVIGHDPYLYPTLVLLAYFVFGIIRGFVVRNKKTDLSTDEKVEKYRKKLKRKRTLLGTTVHIVYVSYFVYMLYFLIV